MRYNKVEREIYSLLSPLDHRYYLSCQELFNSFTEYLSENALIRTELEVEAALTRVLAKRGICSQEAALEVEEACRRVRPEEVYEEEAKTKHNIRALVNCIQKKVSPQTRPFVHLTSTSMDIVDTANALRIKRATREILLPKAMKLLEVLIEIALREKETLQVGRTHGQHAVPITFGFAMAEYVSRFGNRVVKIMDCSENLRGKISGAVGAYNAASLFFTDPEIFEAEVLAELGVRPSPYSSQIVAPEYLTDYLHSIISTFGTLANLADDLRHLQRTEIAEISEEFTSRQVGSSTMPHKRNPWNLEHVKSMWKAFMPRMVTVYMDQISEHQRDLTNSASGRFNPEIVVAFTAAMERLIRVLKRLKVNREMMKRNFNQTRESLIAEPLYIILASVGHPDAHEAVRRLTLKSQETGEPVGRLARKMAIEARDPLTEGKREEQEPWEKELQSYLSALSEEQWNILSHPQRYTGIAVRKTEALCEEWRRFLAEALAEADDPQKKNVESDFFG